MNKTQVWISLRRQYPKLDKAIAVVSGWFGRVNWRSQFQPQEMSVYEEPTHTARFQTNITHAEISSGTSVSSNT
jgi:hypothetical protein